MEQSILLVHVGPVQDFISSARRCRDLWYGSRLLSETSRAVAQALIRASGGEQRDVLVFPGRLNARTGEDVSVANKIQLTVQSGERDEVARIAESGRERLEAFLVALAREQFDAIQGELLRYDRAQKDDLKLERAVEQVRTMMEYFWVAVPIQAEGYGAARRRAEALLAARKNTRNWSAATFHEYGVPKSALDGVRESVIDERVYGDKRGRNSYPNWMRYRAFGIRSSERLCGVGLLKRRGQLQHEASEGPEQHAPPFHSASHVASAPTRCRLETRGLGDAWSAFLEQAGAYLNLSEFRTRYPRDPEGEPAPFYEASDPRYDDAPRLRFRHALPNQGGASAWGYDGVLLYPGRMSGTGERSLLGEVDLSGAGLSRRQISDKLVSAQRALLKQAGAPGQEPFAYYALLQADGDRMGRAIDALGDQALHQRFSRDLDASFASQCGALVAAHGGSLIYSGGDDVLALLPLHTALQCAEALRASFCEAMERAFSTLTDRTIERPTLSVGLAVAHHLEPFGEVRQQARQAEALAKESGRDRLAIVVRKRGNASLSVVGVWDNLSETPALRQRLRMWARVYSHKELPSALAYKLEDCVAALSVDRPGEHPGALGDVSVEDFTALCRSLVRGVVARRSLSDDRLEDALVELFDWTLQEQAGATTAAARLRAPVRAVQQMAQELRIASVFAEAWDVAFEDPNEGGSA